MSFDVPTVIPRVHERIAHRSIIEAVKKRNGVDRPAAIAVRHAGGEPAHPRGH